MDEDELTPQERGQMEETPGETPEEAHRVGEYDELRDLISDAIARIDAVGEAVDAIREAVDAIRDAVSTFRAVGVDNGAEFTEAAGTVDLDGDGDADIVKIPEFSDMDLDI